MGKFPRQYRVGVKSSITVKTYINSRPLIEISEFQLQDQTIVVKVPMLGCYVLSAYQVSRIND